MCIIIVIAIIVGNIVTQKLYSEINWNIIRRIRRIKKKNMS